MRQSYWWDHDARLISKYVLAIQYLLTTSVSHLILCVCSFRKTIRLTRPYGGATYSHVNLQTHMMDALIVGVAEIISIIS
jgi:hypothetical protein